MPEIPIVIPGPREMQTMSSQVAPESHGKPWHHSLGVGEGFGTVKAHWVIASNLGSLYSRGHGFWRMI